MSEEKQSKKKRKLVKGQKLESPNPLPMHLFLSLLKDGYTVKVGE